MQIKLVSRSAIEEEKKLNALIDSLKGRLVMWRRPRIIFADTTEDGGKLGFYDRSQNLIVINKAFLSEADKSDERAVFLHELSHAEDFARRGFSRHDETFKALCKELGVPDGFEKAKVKLKAEKKEKIKGKVDKLIRLSESPFEAESSEALHKAQSLMAEYGIIAEESDESVLYTATIDAKKKYFYYEKAFLSIITKLSGVYIIREADKSGVYFANAYGTVEQVLFAYETYRFLQDSIYMAYVHERIHGDFNLDQFSFYTGLSNALYTRIVEGEDQNVSKALVVSYEDNSNKFREIFSDKHITRTKNKTRYTSADAYNRGERAAKDINVGKMEKGGTKVKKIEGPKS